MDIRKWIKKKEPTETATTSGSELQKSSVDTDSAGLLTPLKNTQPAKSKDSPSPSSVPEDLGKSQSRFVSSSVQREWLEYSEQADSAFCFPCWKFGGSDSVFTSTGFSNWKHATDKAKGFYRHANSKEHLAFMAIWKEH